MCLKGVNAAVRKRGSCGPRLHAIFRDITSKRTTCSARLTKRILQPAAIITFLQPTNTSVPQYGTVAV